MAGALRPDPWDTETNAAGPKDCLGEHRTGEISQPGPERYGGGPKPGRAATGKPMKQSPPGASGRGAAI